VYAIILNTDGGTQGIPALASTIARDAPLLRTHIPASDGREHTKPTFVGKVGQLAQDIHKHVMAKTGNKAAAASAANHTGIGKTALETGVAGAVAYHQGIPQKILSKAEEASSGLWSRIKAWGAKEGPALIEEGEEMGEVIGEVAPFLA
jgi:hypothetical protein